MNEKLAPVHPGEILLEEYLKPLGLSQYQLAKAIRVPTRRINEIVHGKRSVTADTALRLARYFSTTERFWLNLQVRHDIEVEKDKLGERLAREISPHPMRRETPTPSAPDRAHPQVLPDVGERRRVEATIKAEVVSRMDS